MQRTLDFTETLTLLYCANCGMAFGVTQDFEKRRRGDHKSFYCPWGHPQSFSQKSEEEVLKEKLAREKENAEWWRKRKLEEEQARERAERQRDAYKGHATRLKKRVSKGKCPVCACEFVTLAAHMKKRHPDYGMGEDGSDA